MSIITSGSALSFAGLKPLQPRLVTPSAEERAATAAMVQADKPKSNVEIFADMSAHLKEQEALKAHTVFKNGGRVVGVLYEDGSAVYPSGGAGGAGGGAGSGVAQGNQGLGAYADSIGAALRKSYGSGVTAERGTDSDTQGRLSDSLFRSEDRLGSYRFLDALAGRGGKVAFDTATLEAMSGL